MPGRDGDGYFPRGSSVLRMVQEERAVGLLYGQRALGIGALRVPNFVGTARHTRFPERPFARLVVTAKMFETIFFGTRAQADKVLATVHRLHSAVEGELPEDAGPHPAGTPYSAFDPVAMLWTVAVAADSAKVFYELLVRRLDEDERDALWADWVRFGELFGMPRDVAPASYREFREWYDGFIAGPEAFLTEEARHVGSAVMFRIPVSARGVPAMRVHNLLMLGSLPPPVREHYGLRWMPAHAGAFAAAVRGLRAGRPALPGALKRGRNDAFFDDVAGAERRLAGRGAVVPGSLAGYALGR